MGRIGKEEDAELVKVEKKSKKSKKNKTKDPLDVGDDSPNEKGHKHKEKKRKSKENKDRYEARHEKRDFEEDNGDLRKNDKKKQRKRDSSEDDQIKEHEPRKEKKRKHKHYNHETKLENDDVDGKSSPDKDTIVTKKDVLSVDKKNNEREEKKKKKKRSDGNGIEISREEHEGDLFEKIDKKKKKKKKTTEESGKEDSKGKKKNFEKPKTKHKPKKVTFSSNVEVFSSPNTHSEKQKPNGDGLTRGKRFTPEEDEIVKEAVYNYIKTHGLGDEGLKMVLNCSSYPGMKNCWLEIAKCIPYRPYTAVYYRAHILFERAEQRSWTLQEIEFLHEFHKKHGNKWKMAAEELGKHRFHVKDTWRRIRFKHPKGARWTQDEYQSLYDLVNLDLKSKVTFEEKKSKHGMLRDNIPWTTISNKLSTRSDASCCQKWYDQLSSSLVAEKKWADADDYRLIGALYERDDTCVEDVDWDDLLEHRSGEICRKRWNQMVMHIGHHGSKPFAEQVDTLAKRYLPDLAETREAWDNKPVGP